MRILACALCVLVLAGCTTLAPGPINSSEPSWDGGQQTSGFLGFDPDGYGIITPHARDRYNGLVAIYGRAWVPPVCPDDGITPALPNFRIDPEHLAKFATMNRWLKEGRKP